MSGYCLDCGNQSCVCDDKAESEIYPVASIYFDKLKKIAESPFPFAAFDSVEMTVKKKLYPPDMYPYLYPKMTFKQFNTEVNPEE